RTCAREERAGGLALARTAPARLAHLGGAALELGGRIHVQAAVEPPCHHRTSLELVTKSRRENDPTLRVEGVLVLPQEHLRHLRLAGPTPISLGALPFPPLRTTL